MLYYSSVKDLVHFSLVPHYQIELTFQSSWSQWLDIFKAQIISENHKICNNHMSCHTRVLLSLLQPIHKFAAFLRNPHCMRIHSGILSVVFYSLNKPLVCILKLTITLILASIFLWCQRFKTFSTWLSVPSLLHIYIYFFFYSRIIHLVLNNRMLSFFTAENIPLCPRATFFFLIPAIMVT